MDKTYKIGRSAKTGRFTTIKKAKAKKNTHVVETIKKRGYDYYTGPKKIKLEWTSKK